MVTYLFPAFFLTPLQFYKVRLGLWPPTYVLHEVADAGQAYFLHTDGKFFQHHWLKTTLSSLNCLLHMLKINWPSSWGSLSERSLLSHRSTCLFLPSFVLGINNLCLLSFFLISLTRGFINFIGLSKEPAFGFLFLSTIFLL